MELYAVEKKVLAIQFGLDCLQMAHDCVKDEQKKAILKILEENQWFFCQLDMANLLYFRFSHHLLLSLNIIEDMSTFHQYLLMSVRQLY